jgi:hypothetical protein
VGRHTQVAAAAGAAITRALHEFGPKVVSLKLVNPCLSKLLSNTNGKVLCWRRTRAGDAVTSWDFAQVREEGKNLGVELYRWLGAMFKAEVENNKDLKPAQVRRPRRPCAARVMCHGLARVRVLDQGVDGGVRQH